MCHICMQDPHTLTSQSVIPNQNLVAGFKPKGKHKLTKQRNQARDRQADHLQVIGNDYMVLWRHGVAIPQQQGQWEPKGVHRSSSRNTYTSLFSSDSPSGSACLAFIKDSTWAKGKGKESCGSLFAFTLMPRTDLAIPLEVLCSVHHEPSSKPQRWCLSWLTRGQWRKTHSFPQSAFFLLTSSFSQEANHTSNSLPNYCLTSLTLNYLCFNTLQDQQRQLSLGNVGRKHVPSQFEIETVREGSERPLSLSFPRLSGNSRAHSPHSSSTLPYLSSLSEHTWSLAPQALCCCLCFSSSQHSTHTVRETVLGWPWFWCTQRSWPCPHRAPARHPTSFNMNCKGSSGLWNSSFSVISWDRERQKERIIDTWIDGCLHFLFQCHLHFKNQESLQTPKMIKGPFLLLFLKSILKKAQDKERSGERIIWFQLTLGQASHISLWKEMRNTYITWNICRILCSST